jgi:hypothetical protein
MSALMPRYFFDVIDSDGIQRDEQGQVFQDVQQADEEALTALLDIAREYMLRREDATLRIEVRNDQDNVVLRKSLDLKQDVIDR